jgi:hypothetical protein
MSATSDAVTDLLATTSSGQQMVKKYGSDWTKWPTTSSWYQALELINPQPAPTPAPPPPAPTPTPPPSPTAFPDPPVGAVIGPPIFLRSTAAATTTKLHVASSSDDGIGNMVWPPKPSTGVWTLQDCIAENCAANPPRSLNGTGEAGFWIGQQTNADRLVATNCAWMGMWTGAYVNGSTISNFDLSGNPHVGLYCEHVTSEVTFDRFKINHAGDGNAVNVEWWYADSVYGPLLPYGGKAGSGNITWQNFDITVPAGKWAFFLDAGTFGCTIQNGIIRGAGNGIAHPANLVDPTKPNVIDWASIQFLATGQKELVHNNAIG